MIPIASPDLKQIAVLMETVRDSDTTPLIKESINIASNLLVKALSSTNPILRTRLEGIVATFNELASQNQFPALQVLADKLEHIVFTALSPNAQKKKLSKRSQRTTPELSKPTP